ncbi:GatB/YqeY domain-containing protein [Candidatus Gracilibacteria bacterium]|nr:GatB/YqeY domain-containing protein [Candidatus Gracilibacteria bacterium]MCF7856144.1 GatB/YqeY domain-containing protein [Candidatus Gracilibacteria bacterium]MCF7896610.1 GatB/YqeY domain-containing protein [Candidatus Gracilibacteria bacterium]
MNLKSQIVADLTVAMKNSAELEKEVLRMLKAEIMKAEVAGSEKKELSDDEIVKILKRMVKQRYDSIEQFEKGGRTELAAREKSEIPLLEKYLPAQIAPEKIAEIVATKKAELQIFDKSKMGMLIGAVMKEVGDSADGSIVKNCVEKSFE